MIHGAATSSLMLPPSSGRWPRPEVPPPRRLSTDARDFAAACRTRELARAEAS